MMELPKFKYEFNMSGESLLPHRPPFLFLDTLISADETGAIGAYTYTFEKNVETGVVTIRYSEPVGFPVHFHWETTVAVDGTTASTQMVVE